MIELLSASRDALHLLLSGNPELWEIVAISFSVSLRAILIATPPALLLAFILSNGRFPGRRLLITLFNTLLSVPAVVVGLLVYIMLSRHGPLGEWRLLFTQSAMIIGQCILAFPILTAMGLAALQAADRRAWETAITLGAPPWRAVITVMFEVRFALLAAVVAAFSRIVSEVGCSMMVGGNILHVTRNIPTAIALETHKGAFSEGIALGIVLFVLALVLNLALNALQGRGESH